MDTQTQIDRLIELAIIQRSELKQLVEQLPQLREHLNAEVEKVFDETEPQLRAELEEWTTKQTADKTAALGVALESKIADLAKSLEISTQARYNAIIAEREENARLAAQAEAKIAEHAASLPGAVKEIVSAELARFPRAGEIDQLRKEFAEPKSLNPRGKWQAGETYNKLDLVTINGDSYVSNIDGNTEKPSRSAANWTLNAARGNSGGGGGVTSLTDLVPVPSNGQLLIGNGSAFVNNTLTAGTGVTITNGAGTITIDASGAQEILTATVKNAESVAITRGQVVYLFSATGGFPSVKLAYNTSDATSAKTFGVVSDVSIAPNGTGTITCVGVVSNLNLGAYNDGDTVYLGATPGSFTATKPYAPNHLVYVGIIERANAGNGELYVRIQNGYELDEIHDVQINSPLLAGQTLIYDATTDLWKNARLTAGVGVSISNGDSAITISADGGVNYQGTWNASTNTPTLTSSVGTKGFYYVVSVAGSTNLNGVTDWKVGDWAIFNGTAWEKVDTTDQVSSVFGRTGAVVGVSTDYSAVGITNTAIGASNPSTGAFTTLSASTSLTSPDLTLGSSGPSVKSTLSARAPRQGLVFNGTSGTSIANSTAFGTNDFTVAAIVNGTSFATVPRIFGGAANSFALLVTSGGTLQSSLQSSADNTVSTGALTAGKNSLVVYVRSGTTGTYYINGIAAGTTTDSRNYSAATTFLGATLSLTTVPWIGVIDGALIYNRALSASEVVALYEAGAPAGADYPSKAAGVTMNSSAWTNIGYTSLTSANGGTFTAVKASGDGYAILAPAAPAIKKGTKIKVSGVLTLNNGKTVKPSVYIDEAGASLQSINVASGASFSYELTAVTNAATSVTFTSNGDADYTISSLVITSLGLLLAPDAAQAGGGLVWYDTSGNAANITLPASGVSWNVPFAGYVTAPTTTNLTLAGGSSGSNIVLGQGASGTISAKSNNAIFGLLAAGGSFRTFNTAGDTAFASYGNDGDGRARFGALTNTDVDIIQNNTVAMRLTATNRNFLIGTTTDSANGKLQLATHTTSAGGIGFGTDVALFHRATGVGLTLSSIGSTTPYFTLDANGTNVLDIFGLSSDVYFDQRVAGKSLFFRTNGATLALTLDSSQNATFAGTVKSAVATGGRTLQATPSVTVAQDAVQNLVTQNYGFFLISEVSITGSIAIIGFNAGGTYLVWQEGTNYSTTINTASKFNVYYSSGNQLVVQNKKTGSASFNIINLAGGS